MNAHQTIGKTILITGGTGSWGNELVRQLLAMKNGPKEIRIYSRGEHKQVEMKAHYNNPKLKFIIGDVRDKNILNFAMKGVTAVFHLAALKHVPVCEDNPWEAVLTNIYGTQNVIETAIANNVGIVVDVSTDKAVDPFNLYGVTKSAGEKLIINANKLNSKTKFMCVRGGNVIGTNGSVIPLFKHQILTKNQITVTDPLMTRFLMSTREAIGLIFKAIEHYKEGDIFVLKMPAATVKTIAKALIELFGNEKTKIRVIGKRQGEKMHELLVSKNEMPFTDARNDSFYIIHPAYKEVKIKKVVELPEFSSQNTQRLNTKRLVELLKKERWLFDEQTSSSQSDTKPFRSDIKFS
jgi:FlaA1/EpsC-like NDP-sugar epimerase